MNKKRVLYIADTPLIDGAGKALLNILYNMTKHVDILVVFPRKGPLCQKIEQINIEIKFIDYVMNIYPAIHSFRDFALFVPRVIKLSLKNWIALTKLCKISKEFNPDIIHTNVGPLTLGYNLSKKTGIPHIWHIREYQDLGFGWTPIPSMSNFISKLKKKNNTCIAISNDIFKHYRMSTNSKIIYDGIFDKTKTPKINLNKKKYLLFVGRIEKGKGIKQLIEAYIEFRKYNNRLKLLIAGQGEEQYTKQLIKIIEDSGITNSIDFLGFRSDVYNLMSEAYALVVPSIFEGFGFITAEAMFNGCLVIGNNTAGTKEQFDNGLKRHGNEIGVRYFGHKELVKSLNILELNGIEFYIPMIKRAQETVSNLYSLEQNEMNISKLYNEITSKYSILGKKKRETINYQ